jgi:hypothetical protein
MNYEENFELNVSIKDALDKDSEEIRAMDCNEETA